MKLLLGFSPPVLLRQELAARGKEKWIVRKLIALFDALDFAQSCFGAFERRAAPERGRAIAARQVTASSLSPLRWQHSGLPSAAPTSVRQ